MNTVPPAGTSRFLRAALWLLLIASPLVPDAALAASWQWSAQPGRERIEIRFDAPIKTQTASRTGTTRLAVQLGAPAEAFSGQGKGTLVRGVSPKGTTLEIDLRDPAFGYVVSKPDARTLRVDVFADALGARWKGPDTAASTAAAPTSTASTPATAAATPPAAPKTPPASAAQPAKAGQAGPTIDASRAVASVLPPMPADASKNQQSQTTSDGKGKPAETGPRVDPRTMGRQPMSDGRNVMATASTRPVAQTPGNATSPTAQTSGAQAAATPQMPLGPGSGSGSSADSGTPPVLFPGYTNIKPVADPSLPSSSDISKLTSRLEAMGVGEPRPELIRSAMAAEPETAPGSTVRGRMLRPGETPEAVSSAPPVAASATVPVATPQASPAQQTPSVQQGTPAQQKAPVQQNAPAGQTFTETPLTAQPGTQPTGQPATPPASATGTTTSPGTSGAMVRQRMNIMPPPSATLAPAQTPAQATTPQNPAQNSVQATPQAPVQTAQPTQPATGTPRAGAPAGAVTGSLKTGAPQGAGTAGGAVSGPMNQARQPMGGQTGQAGQPQYGQPTQTAAPEPPVAPATQPTHATKPSAKYEPPKESVVERTGNSPFAPQQPQQAAQSEGTNAYVFDPASPDSRKLLNMGEDAKGEGKAEAAPEKQVIYVDEQGNIVDKPPDIPALLADAKKSMNDLQYTEAREKLVAMKDLVLPRDIREQVLYLISEADSNLWRDKPLAGYEPVTSSTSEAMNFNLESERVPEALYRLGMLNLQVDNQENAAGYFGAMRTRYGHHELVPQGFLALGRDQLKKQQYADAVRSFQLIMDSYPESKTVRDAARGMAEALYRQGHYDRAQILADFVDRRWPRIYLEDPAYLPMVGEIQTRMQNYDAALQTYWTAYNLTPDKPENHRLLLQIGAIYLQSGFVKGAREVLNELLRKYPQSDSAPKAVLLMAEQGFLGDNPTLDQMFTMFGKAGDMPVEAAYRRILKDYPDSPEAKLIAIRDAALTYWNGDTDEAMQKAQIYIAANPSRPETARAYDIIKRGFARSLDLAKQEDNYDRILTLWERFPEVHPDYTPLDDELTVAMARAKLNRGDEAAGLADLAPFLDKPQGKYSDYVYNLFLAKHLHDNNWNAILNLGEKMEKWKLPTDVRNQLDYSMAISAENLGLRERAMPLWAKLYKLPDGDIPPYQKAYASYFMARDAENRRDLKDAYDLNRETLDRFNKLADERSDKADPERVRESLAGLMDVTEVAGRFAEALDWSEQYASFVPQGSPDHAGLLFRQARLHRKMGDMARWRNLLTTIVQREPDSVFGRMAASEMRTQEVSRDLTRFMAQPGQSATAAAAAAAGNAGPAPQTAPTPAGAPAGTTPAAPAGAPAATPAAPTATPAASTPATSAGAPAGTTPAAPAGAPAGTPAAATGTPAGAPAGAQGTTPPANG